MRKMTIIFLRGEILYVARDDLSRDNIFLSLKYQKDQAVKELKFITVGTNTSTFFF